MTRVPSDADFVFFPTQQPADAQTFAQQLLEQGKKAKVFGGDGSNNAVAVQGAGLVRLELRAGHQRHRVQQGAHRRLEEGQPEGTLGSFGPPTYLAVEVALNAIKKACDAGKGQIKNRRDVVRNVKKINLKNSILGGTFRFSTKSNDPLNAKFYIFQIQSNGTYKLVG